MRRRPVEGKVQCSDEGQPGGRIVRSELYAVDHGSVLVADERVGDAFTAPGDPVERSMYGWSVLHCLPATLAERPVEATGTVLRAPTVARWAAAAGFGGFEVLPIDCDDAGRPRPRADYGIAANEPLVSPLLRPPGSW
jgi:hypothetical protein